MQMLHGLAGVCAAVGNHPVAVFQALCLGDGGDHLENVGNHAAVFGGNAAYRGNVPPASDIVETAVQVAVQISCPFSI